MLGFFLQARTGSEICPDTLEMSGHDILAKWCSTGGQIFLKFYYFISVVQYRYEVTNFQENMLGAMLVVALASHTERKICPDTLGMSGHRTFTKRVLPTPNLPDF